MRQKVDCPTDRSWPGGTTGTGCWSNSGYPGSRRERQERLRDPAHRQEAPRHEITRLLLELGPDSNQRVNEKNNILLDAGSDPNLGADSSEKLLHWHCSIIASRHPGYLSLD
jgi:hypothetical protein